MNAIRILTYNVQTGKKIDRIIDWLNRLPDTDIICLQEFPKDKIEECIYLLGRVPYGYAFAEGFTFRKRMFGQLTLFRKDSVTDVSTETIRFDINRLERSILRTSVPRSCLVITCRFGTKRISLANVHIVALASNRVKFAQINALLESMQLKTPRVVLLGDFNISSILGKRKLFTIMKTAGYSAAQKKISTHRVGVIKHQFDYLFARQCSISDQRALKVRLSDHFPVYALCQV